MTIMTVDDSKAVRLMVSIALKQAGYFVIEAACGADALELLKINKVDLIFCDFNMPGMNGAELVSQIKACEEYRLIPVIMLTTENVRGRLLEAKEAGAVGWMMKPFKTEDLVATVKTLSEKYAIS